MGPDSLTSAHRRSIGIALKLFDDLLAADYLDEQSRRLSELTMRLMDRLRRSGG